MNMNIKNIMDLDIEKALNSLALFLSEFLHVSDIFDTRIDYEDFIIDVKVPNQELNILYIKEKLNEYIEKNNIPLVLEGITVRAITETESEETMKLYLVLSFSFC